MKRHLAPLIALVMLAASQAAEQVKFTLVPNFFEKDPGGEQLGPCHGAALIDKAGNIYITTDTPKGIKIFSPDGKFIKSVGTPKIHGAELREENGVEYIYGARPEFHEVVKLKLDGEKVWSIGYPAEAGTAKDANGFKPCAVTVGPDGSVFIADGYGSNFIYKFDKNQKFVKAFGGKGSEEGKFQTCHGIALDGRYDKPLLLVCNRENLRVEHWDLDGNFVKVIQTNLRRPSAVHIRGDNAVFAELAGRVTLLDKSGAIIAHVGDNPNEKLRANYNAPKDQWTDGIFNSPHGVSLDKNGDLIVSEWTPFGRIHKLVRAK